MMNAKRSLQQWYTTSSRRESTGHCCKKLYLSVFTKVILASGYYAAFRVTLVAKSLEGLYDGAVHITTDYEVSGPSDLLLASFLL